MQISYGPRNLSAALDKITKPLFSKKGFAESRLITDWEYIVGKKFASVSSPKRMMFADKNRNQGTLYIEVCDSAVAMELSYLEPALIEKIATFFGYRAVSKIRITQKPKQIVWKDEKKEMRPLLAEQQEKQLEQAVQHIEDEELRASLLSLGKNVKVSNS